VEFPDFSLTDKVALVTGGDKGIGQGIAVAMAHAGASVAFTTRHLPRAGETGRMLEEQGCPAMAVELDVTKLEMIQPVVEQVMERFGRIDVLVNNAGFNVPQDPFAVTEEAWDTVYDTNVKGLFFVSQAIGKVMSEQGGGKIVNIASQAGLVAMPKRAVYCSTKAAVIHITRVLALEWGPLNIQVNSVAPTFVRTPLTAPMLDDPEFAKYVDDMILLDRLGRPEDVAAAVIYLASPASNLVTGHTLVVDGGWTIS
jgi:NAD(P)-dependent dehydrogenase (short-subunit alcohol dehydrogenase family)